MPADSPALTRPLVLLMAVATGLAVSCNYYAQPLLGTIAADFGISHASAGFLVTTAQLAYGLGLLLIVPLGDLFERRRMIVAMTVLTGVGLAVTAAAPGIGMALAGAALTGLVTVLAQVLLPLAATLATPDTRGRVIGTMMSGLIMGILLGRTVAGALAAVGGWRTVYWVMAPVMLVMAALLWRALPSQRAGVALPYPRLIASVLGLLREEPVLRERALLGGITFAIFSVLWTSMAFLLSAPPYGFPDPVIGLFGLAGAAGVMGASLAGRLADRHEGPDATRWGLALLLASWLPIWLGAGSVAALVTGIVILDLAVQVVHVSNQAAVYRLRPEARSRVTSAYMTSYFMGGAAGSAASAIAFQIGGWDGVVAAGVALSAGGVFAGWRMGRTRGGSGA